MPSKQGSSRVAVSGGEDFENIHFLKSFVNLGEFFCAFQAGVWQGCCLRWVRFLKKCTSLRIVSILAKFVMLFKQGSSRDAASGGSEF